MSHFKSGRIQSLATRAKKSWVGGGADGKERYTFLYDRLGTFVAAQEKRDGKQVNHFVAEFINDTIIAFNKIWPSFIQNMELPRCGFHGSSQQRSEETYARFLEWYRHKAKQGSASKVGKGATLRIVTGTAKRKMRTYEFWFKSLNEEKQKEMVDEIEEEYRGPRADDEREMNLHNFKQRRLSKAFTDLPESEREMCETRRDESDAATRNDPTSGAILPQRHFWPSNLDEAEVERRNHAVTLQQRYDGISQNIRQVHEQIEAGTGCVGLSIFIGPEPKRAGKISVISFARGRTVDENLTVDEFIGSEKMVELLGMVSQWGAACFSQERCDTLSLDLTEEQRLQVRIEQPITPSFSDNDVDILPTITPSAGVTEFLELPHTKAKGDGKRKKGGGWKIGENLQAIFDAESSTSNTGFHLQDDWNSMFDANIDAAPVSSEDTSNLNFQDQQPVEHTRTVESNTHSFQMHHPNPHAFPPESHQTDPSSLTSDAQASSVCQASSASRNTYHSTGTSHTSTTIPTADPVWFDATASVSGPAIFADHNQENTLHQQHHQSQSATDFILKDDDIHDFLQFVESGNWSLDALQPSAPGMIAGYAAAAAQAVSPSAAATTAPFLSGGINPGMEFVVEQPTTHVETPTTLSFEPQLSSTITTPILVPEHLKPQVDLARVLANRTNTTPLIPTHTPNLSSNSGLYSIGGQPPRLGTSIDSAITYSAVLPSLTSAPESLFTPPASQSHPETGGQHAGPDHFPFTVGDQEIPLDEGFNILANSRLLLELYGVGYGWRVVDMWRQLEKALGFPGSAGKSAKYTLGNSKLRPAALTNWMSKRRDMPTTELANVAEYEQQLVKYYVALSPPSRSTMSGDIFPPPQNAPSDTREWQSLLKGGRNGIYLLLVAIGWLTRLVGRGIDETMNIAFVQDLIWTLEHLVNVAPKLSDTTTPQPTNHTKRVSEEMAENSPPRKRQTRRPLRFVEE